eukprot:scaffold86939_cov32-Tisochrysis_lutea.AAC.1
MAHRAPCKCRLHTKSAQHSSLPVSPSLYLLGNPPLYLFRRPCAVVRKSFTKKPAVLSSAWLVKLLQVTATATVAG